MKKFIQKKIDKKLEPVERLDWIPVNGTSVVFDPPLPLGSPPRTPHILSSPKREMVEPEDQDIHSDQELPDASIIKSELSGIRALKKKSEPNDLTNGEKSKICKDFLRNDCNRAHCIFRHEFDSSLLPKIYQFCKDFQNLGCKRPNCKFAHATVFEQERFYKTYILPPNALAHQKKQPSNKPGNKPGNKPVNKAVKNPLGQVDNTYMMMLPPPPPPVTNVTAYSPSVPDVTAYRRPVPDVTAYPRPVSDVTAYRRPVPDVTAYRGPVPEVTAYRGPVPDGTAYRGPVPDGTAYRGPVPDVTAYPRPVPAYPPPQIITGGEAVNTPPLNQFLNVAVNDNVVLNPTKNNTNDLKRPWTNSDNINATLHSQDSNAKRLIECTHCQNMENRLFNLRVRYETMTKEASEKAHKIMLIKTKQNILNNFIALLVKPTIPASSKMFTGDQDAGQQRMEWLKGILNMQQHISKLTPEQLKFLLAKACSISNLHSQLSTWKP